MAKQYTKTTWVDEVLTEAARYNILEDGGVMIQEEVQIKLATEVVIGATAADVATMQNIEDGIDEMDTLLRAVATEKTVASGVLTVDQSRHKVQPESGTADDITSIVGMEADTTLVLFASDPGTDTLTFKHQTNISCFGGEDIELSQGMVVIYFDGTKHYISGGGGGGAAGLANSNISPTTANVTAAVNTRYFADVSGLTANRNFTLPTATIGDEIALNIKVGDGDVIGTDFALIIIGDTGIKINGGSTATAWRKVWKTGDRVRLIADAADDWIVVQDGRVRPRGLSEASSATPTINTDSSDIHRVTALAENITSVTTNLSGTPTHGQKLQVEITDNGTALAIAWGASFASFAATLPTTTVLGKLLRVFFQWDSADSTWDCMAVANEP